MRAIFFTLLVVVLSSFSRGKNSCYVVVDQPFKDKWEWHKKGQVVIKTATDTNGNIVVSCVLLNEFSEIFDTMQNLEFVWLSPEAFPVDSSDWD